MGWDGCVGGVRVGDAEWGGRRRSCGCHGGAAHCAEESSALPLPLPLPPSPPPMLPPSPVSPSPNATCLLLAPSAPPSPPRPAAPSASSGRGSSSSSARAARATVAGGGDAAAKRAASAAAAGAARRRCARSNAAAHSVRILIKSRGQCLARMGGEMQGEARWRVCGGCVVGVAKCGGVVGQGFRGRGGYGQCRVGWKVGGTRLGGGVRWVVEREGGVAYRSGASAASSQAALAATTSSTNTARCAAATLRIALPPPSPPPQPPPPLPPPLPPPPPVPPKLPPSSCTDSMHSGTPAAPRTTNRRSRLPCSPPGEDEGEGEPALPPRRGGVAAAAAAAAGRAETSPRGVGSLLGLREQCGPHGLRAAPRLSRRTCQSIWRRLCVLVRLGITATATGRGEGGNGDRGAGDGSNSERGSGRGSAHRCVIAVGSRRARRSVPRRSQSARRSPRMRRAPLQYSAAGPQRRRQRRWRWPCRRPCRLARRRRRPQRAAARSATVAARGSRGGGCRRSRAARSRGGQAARGTPRARSSCPSPQR